MGKTDKTIPLVLASSSPRRRQLLRQAGIAFRVVAPPITEPAPVPRGVSAARQAEALAYFKAKAALELAEPGEYVLAADTLVALGRRILAKPADRAEAREMLHSLSGTTHEVITGVVLLGPGAQRLIASETTRVTMRPMSGQEIDAYIASGEWAGKAGAYAIQETADRFIEDVSGSFTNVVGLPMELVDRMIGELRAHPASHGAPR